MLVFADGDRGQSAYGGQQFGDVRGELRHPHAAPSVPIGGPVASAGPHARVEADVQRVRRHERWIA